MYFNRMKSARRNKKLEERIILKFFSHAFSDFPDGRIIDSESPDFIVKQSPKRSVGIEITRLTAPDGSANDINGMKIDSHEREVCALARKLFEANHNLKLFVDIFFKPSIKIEEGEQQALAGMIAEDIEKGLNSVSKQRVFQFEIDNPNANDVIDFIHVTCFPGLEHSRWDNAGRYFLPALSRELLENSINLKEEKLPIYKKKNISFYWLILFINSLNKTTSFNINDQVTAWDIQSAFDRVFLFELLNFRVIEI